MSKELQKVDLVPFMALHLSSLISERGKWATYIRYRPKNTLRLMTKPRSGYTLVPLMVTPPLDIKDEFFAPELHIHHPCHQLVPGNSFFNYHQTPPLFRKQITKKTKNLPKANTPQQPPTSPEPTQPRGLDEVLISELRELRKLRMDPSKARNLRSTISIIHFAKDPRPPLLLYPHSLRHTLYPSTLYPSSTLSTSASTPS